MTDSVIRDRWRPWLMDRISVAQVEEGGVLAPKFDFDGLIAVITTDARSGEVLMMGTMNAETLHPHHRFR